MSAPILSFTRIPEGTYVTAIVGHRFSIERVLAQVKTWRLTITSEATGGVVRTIDTYSLNFAKAAAWQQAQALANAQVQALSIRSAEATR